MAYSSISLKLYPRPGWPQGVGPRHAPHARHARPAKLSCAWLRVAARGSGPAFGALDPIRRLRVTVNGVDGEEKRRLRLRKTVDRPRNTQHDRSTRFNLMHLGIRADDSARVNGPKWQFTAPKHAGCGPRIACACGRVGERQGGIVCRYLLKCEGARYRKDCAPLSGSARTAIRTLAR